MQSFINKFWNHPLNRIDQRLQAMSDELARAGDLFILLFRNEQDGMSYVRFVPKERIVEIVTAENDWETEILYRQITDDPANPIDWVSPFHPQAEEAPAIMLHYAVNRPIGASFGEGDLDTIIPWLLRYSSMLEDRVRLHWAIRSFLWFVTVPTNRVEAKKSEYSRPPEAGSIIVKDDAEQWEVQSPNLRGSDAKWDMQSVRHMIDAVGFPPHWRGEGGDANLATATAMQLRPERHLAPAPELHGLYPAGPHLPIVCSRASAINKAGGGVPRTPFHNLFNANVSDISRTDNTTLATASHELSESLNNVFTFLPPSKSPTLSKLALRLIFKFAGEPQDDSILNDILTESGYDPKMIDDVTLSTGIVEDLFAPIRRKLP